MGLGGDLIWTAVLRHVESRTGKATRIAFTPLLSDLLVGRLYDAARSPADHPVFFGNRRFNTFPKLEKSAFAVMLDRLWSRWILPGLNRIGIGELLMESLYQKAQARLGVIWFDRLEHSYAQAETAERMVWRQGASLVGVVTASVLSRLGHQANSAEFTDHRCELTFLPAEENLVGQKIPKGPWVAFEPDSNPEYFGALRLWPRDNWIKAVTQLSALHPEVTWVQVGVGEPLSLPASVRAQPIAGQTTFREAALAIKNAKLFIGTEGGLIHAANAVGVSTVALWGGVTRPQFAGYPNRHKIIHHPTDCALGVGCGRKGSCPNQVVCMTSISVEEVVSAVSEGLRGAGQ